MTSLPLVLQVLLALLVLTAGAYDIRFRRIPNWLAVAGLVLGVGTNTFLFRAAGLRVSGLGFGFAFVVYLVLYALRAMGAGDVKLMAAVGSIVGPFNWFLIFIVTALMGGIVALVLLLFRGRLQKTLWNVGFILSEMSRMRAPYVSREELDVKNPKAVTLPHGAVIALGSLVFLLIGALWSPR